MNQLSRLMFRLTLVLLGSIWANATWAGENTSAQTAKATPAKNLVVMELFTSQGCSSCPPADALLAKYTNTDSTIYPLAFHVDYWNSLGWRDPFSQAQFTQRQYDYAHYANTTQVYTPQIIMNGQERLVGSNKNEIASLVKQQQAQPATAKLTVDNLQIKKNVLTFNYRLSNADLVDYLNIALVQPRAITTILRGENGGRKLINSHIVKQFFDQKITASTGQLSFALDPVLNIRDLKLVIYAQQNHFGKIVAAARVQPVF